MAKQEKNFKENITESFITPRGDNSDYTPPAGYKIVPEPKTARIQLLVTPRLKNDLETAAKRQGTSVNNLINGILIDYIEGAKK